MFVKKERHSIKIIVNHINTTFICIHAWNICMTFLCVELFVTLKHYVNVWKGRQDEKLRLSSINEGGPISTLKMKI